MKLLINNLESREDANKIGWLILESIPGVRHADIDIIDDREWVHKIRHKTNLPPESGTKEESV